MHALERNTIRRLAQWFPTKKPKPFRDSLGRLWRETEGGLLQHIQDGCDPCDCETGTGTGTSTGTPTPVTCTLGPCTGSPESVAEYYLVEVTGCERQVSGGGTPSTLCDDDCAGFNGSFLVPFRGSGSFLGVTACWFYEFYSGGNPCGAADCPDTGGLCCLLSFRATRIDVEIVGKDPGPGGSPPASCATANCPTRGATFRLNPVADMDCLAISGLDLPRTIVTTTGGQPCIGGTCTITAVPSP